VVGQQKQLTTLPQTETTREQNKQKIISLKTKLEYTHLQLYNKAMKQSPLLQFGIIFLFVFICFFVHENKTQAQIPANITDAIILKAIPANPSPGQQVRMEVESFTTNLQQASISWSINGQVEQQEIGTQIFTFIAPGAGTQAVVEVSVTLQNGTVFTNQRTVAPSNVDVIIEGITYTPPLYNGRPLFTHESTVNIAAIPTLIENGRRLPSSEVFYGWEINGTYYRDISGVGRDNIIYRGSVVSRPVTIEVTASNITGTLNARKIVTMQPEEVAVLMYENNPLQGLLFGKSLLGEFNLEREELTVTAIPYFFDVTTKDNVLLEYIWGENGTTINNPTLSSSITFRNTSMQKNGVSEIAVITEHLDHLLQNTSRGFTLNVIGNNQLSNQNNDDVTVF